MNPTTQRPDSLSLSCYGALALPLAFGGIPLYLYAPDFYATQQGLSLGLLGTLLLVLRTFDAVSDPLLGYVADRWRPNITITAVAAVLFGAGFVALFSPPAGAGATWFFVCVAVSTLGYSFLTILINAQGAIWAQQGDVQILVTSVRELFVLTGLGLAALLPAILVYFLDPIAAYRWLSLVFAVLLLLAFVAFSRWLGSRPATTVAPSRPASLRAIVNALAGYRHFYFIYSLTLFASSIPAVLFVFFVRDYLALEAWLGLFLFVYFAAGATAMPLWRWLGETYGLIKAWMICLVLALLAFSAVLFLEPGDFWLYLMVCLATGVAFGGNLAIPTAILARALSRADELKYSSSAYAAVAFISKAALAISAGLLFWILGIAGYLPGAANAPLALTTLLICYGLVPLAVQCAALFFLYLRKDSSNENNKLPNIRYRSFSND